MANILPNKHGFSSEYVVDWVIWFVQEPLCLAQGRRHLLVETTTFERLPPQVIEIGQMNL
jgi:hypothetical protein